MGPWGPRALGVPEPYFPRLLSCAAEDDSIVGSSQPTDEFAFEESIALSKNQCIQPLRAAPQRQGAPGPRGQKKLPFWGPGEILMDPERLFTSIHRGKAQTELYGSVSYQI